MRIGIHGASGRVGARLVQAVLAMPDLELGAALVSPGSPRLGTPVDGGHGMEYRAADAAHRSHCDVLIDFSAPAATLRLLDLMGDRPIPVVVGTTGFDSRGEAALTAAAAVRPLLVGANFALGFEAFAAAVRRIAALLPDAAPVVSETYHARKKAEPSGTSRRLAADIADARGAPPGASVPIEVHREGDTVGVNAVRFDPGVTELRMSFTVHTLDAYARGALEGARWLARPGRAPGRYSPADTLDA
ncbi:4-hydroxy-tetrahydrodipicolinate reductase [Azospirillum halopraeferens]|uniref:4-hydroxy-tetrahydrodipicolinate reductase n=1 Tax=Azospirillum halopraeferens TaxID=34010 RepID=UPI0003FF17ED|nr:dihydrodipicolinate reductase C-terminal domain-containing protein [Azospirillum halopraeferens]